MKKFIGALIILAALVASGFANTVIFGNTWLNDGVNDGASSVEHAVISQDGVTFDLTLTAVSGPNINLNAGGNLLGIGDPRFNPEESLKLTLAVSGTALDSLSLNTIGFLYFVGGSDVATFSDGITTNTVTSSMGSANYTDHLAGLTELTKDNIATWQLNMDALDPSIFAITTLTLDYTLHIGPVAPIANADSYDAAMDSIFTNAAPGILANDTDGNGDALSAILVSSPTHGTLLSFSNDGAFIYQPNPGFSGLDTFTYKATDGALDSGDTPVSLAVLEPQAPVASNDHFVVEQSILHSEDAPGVLGNDTDSEGDTLSTILLTTTSHGTLDLFSDGSFTYQPDLGYVGPDSFTYKANDGVLDSAGATVAIEVTPVALSLAQIFGSGMVLQRELPIRFWGQGPAGETVTISLSSGQTTNTVINSENKWMTTLPPMAATNSPLTLTVSTPETTLTLTGLAVGEVWLCSGQSNMAGRFNPNKDRFIDSAVFDMDLSDFRFENSGNWVSLTSNNQPLVTMVGFFFGIELYKELDIPIGLIQHYNSGTPIQSWMPAEAAEEIGTELNIPPGWNDTGAVKEPGVQFAGLEPTIPITLRGVIWYQGERNAKTYTGWEYRHLLPFHIKTWRELWAAKAGTDVRNFPFYYIQVPTQEGPETAEWAWLRDGMRRALDMTENAGMAIFYDYGPSLHPENKEPAGQRLALWALANDYGYTNLVHCGPLLDDVIFTNHQAVLSFTHIGSGLTNVTGATQLDYFEIAEADGIYEPAEAWIDGDTVVLQSTNVLAPAYVRYLFTKAVPDANFSLMNIEGIPASSFMTDNFMPVRGDRPMPPLTIKDSYSEIAPRAIVVTPQGILANDSPGTNGTVEAQLVEGVSHGILEFNADGSFVYAPTNGFFGNDSFEYIAINGDAHSTTSTVSLTIGEAVGTVPDTFLDWATLHGVAADSAYTLDFAFNLNPHLSERYLLPMSGNSGLPLWELPSTETIFMVEYVRRKNVPGTTYSVQFTDSLTTNWVDSAATETVSPINSTWDRVVVEDEVDSATATNRFGRVIVIQN